MPDEINSSLTHEYEMPEKTLITKLFIKNFKAFGEDIQELPLKRLTLIFGANSSGKSSIIQALLLLKQTFSERSNSSSVLKLREPYVDLKSFQEIIFQHNVQSELVLGLGVSNLEEVIWNFHLKDQIIGVKSVQGLFSRYFRSHLSRMGAFGYSIEKTDYRKVPFISKLYEISKTLKIPGYVDLGLSPPKGQAYGIKVHKKEFVERLMRNKFTKERSMEALKEWNEALEECIQILTELVSEVEKGSLTFNVNVDDYVQDTIDMGTLEFHEWEEINREFYRWFEDKIGRVIQYSSDPLIYIFPYVSRIMPIFEIDRVKKFIDEIRKSLNFSHQIITNFNLEKLKEFFQENLLFEEHVLTVNLMKGRFVETYTSTDTLNNAFNSFIFGSLDLLWPHTLYELIISNIQRNLNKILYIGPLRQKPERFYFSRGFLPANVGQLGENTVELLYHKKKTNEELNQIFEKFNIPYDLVVESVSDKSPDIFSISLVDKVTNTNVSLTEVGFGISQLLPIIVQSYLSTQEFICIEQPEIHLHPRLQAELAQLFVDRINATKEENTLQFLIETHSEHFLLRIQKLLRQKKLSKDDVTILYVEKTEKGSVVHQLEINDRGDFIDGWPEDFIDQSLEEIFG